MKYKYLSILSILTIATVCQSMELKKFSPANISPSGLDTDIEFTLTPQEIETLNSGSTRNALRGLLTAEMGDIGVVAADFAGSYISDIKQKAGRGGAYVKITIRNGHDLHVWQVYGMQEQTEFSRPELQGLPVDGTTWEYGGQNEDAYNRLAANAYCKNQGYTDLKSYSLRELVTPGAWRFDNAGNGKLCAFCKKAFESVVCGR